MLTLGIETSCDETAVAVADGNKVFSSVISSSVHLHSRYGGVIPEIASRYHVEFIGHCLGEAFRKAKVGFSDIGLVSVTQGPGLMSSLLVGISSAKALSLALDIPIIGVNHLFAHIWAVFLNRPRVKFPFVGFIISGGHTNLIYCRSVTDFETLGQTRDDACGEAFDKVAKILKLGYPGGPAIEKRAKKGDPFRIRFPRSYLNDSLDFSFSGVKTAVSYYVKEKERDSGPLPETHVNNIAAGFQESVVDVLARKAVSACRVKKCTTLIVGGGVSANMRLRSKLLKEARAHGIRVYFPKLEFCLDNAAMVAYLGGELFKAGVSSGLDFQAFQNNLLPGGNRLDYSDL